jgi:hypothetical protein
MSGVFQNIDPPTPSPPGECVTPKPLVRGRTYSLGGEGVRGQYFWKTLLCTLHTSVLCVLSPPPHPSILGNFNEQILGRGKNVGSRKPRFKLNIPICPRRASAKAVWNWRGGWRMEPPFPRSFPTARGHELSTYCLNYFNVAKSK